MRIVSSMSVRPDLVEATQAELQAALRMRQEHESPSVAARLARRLRAARRAARASVAGELRTSVARGEVVLTARSTP